MAKNKEVYAKQIVDVAMMGETFGFDMTTETIEPCTDIDCTVCKYYQGKGKSCREATIKWGEQEADVV